MKGAAMGCCGLWEATQLTLQHALCLIALLAGILPSPPAPGTAQSTLRTSMVSFNCQQYSQKHFCPRLTDGKAESQITCFKVT